MSIPKELFKLYAEERLKKLLESDQIPGYIVASFLQVFGDEELVNCQVCNVPVYITPLFLDAAKKHKIPIICSCCVDQQALTGQIVVDIAKIEEKWSEELWEEHLKAALLLVRDFRAKALAADLDPRAVRVALKYALLVDDKFMKDHLSLEEEQKITQIAQMLFDEMIQIEKEKSEHEPREV